MAYQNTKPSHRKNLPAYVKTIILAQAAIILVFTIGMYQEYLANTYLQQYVITLLTSNIVADAMLSMVTMSVFALGTFMILGSMATNRRTNKNWQMMTETANEKLDMPSMPVLETVDASPGTSSRARNRRRKPSVRTNEIFRSMTNYKESLQE